SAASWNPILDAARAHRDARFDADRESGAAPKSGFIVKVKNETGGDLPARSVVGLGSPVITPEDSENRFLTGVAFRGVTPASGHESRFAVLIEPARAGQVVPAFAAGVYQVKVDVSD